jgi:hypothetical protein
MAIRELRGICCGIWLLRRSAAESADYVMGTGTTRGEQPLPEGCYCLDTRHRDT